MSVLSRVMSVLALACVLGPATAVSVQAQPVGNEVDVRWVDPDGVGRSIRLPRSALARNCTPPPAPVIQGERTQLTLTLVRTQTTGRADLVRTTEGYRLVGVDGLMELAGTCEVSQDLLDAMRTARPMADATGAWLAFMILGGTLVLATVGVALAGRGVGPEATLGPPHEDDHGHDDHVAHGAETYV